MSKKHNKQQKYNKISDTRKLGGFRIIETFFAIITSNNMCMVERMCKK